MTQRRIPPMPNKVGGELFQPTCNECSWMGSKHSTKRAALAEGVQHRIHTHRKEGA